MKHFFFRIWRLLPVILLSLMVYGCSSESQPLGPATDVATEPVATTPTVVPSTLTPSPLPPTETATAIPPTQTSTQVPTSTETPTEIPPTFTPTEEPPVATLFGYTVCRHGPGTIYPILKSFTEDGSAIVRGRLDDDSWFLIELPESGETCWIFNEIIEIDKSIAGLPIQTPPPRPTPAPAPTQSEEEKKLGPKYFLIIPDNGGPFACGDGLAYFYSGVKSKGVEDDIKVALNALFSVKTEYVGKYYNPVYQSSLRVKDVEVENGRATIKLGGKFVKPTSECQAKRIHLVVWETARQFSSIKHRPVIWVNNALLGDLLEGIQK